MTFDDYRDRFANIKLDRNNAGVLLVQFHTDNAEMVWGTKSHEEVALCWDFVSRDLDNKIVIVTGTGSSFIDREAFTADEDLASAENFWRVHNTGKRLILSQLEIEVPVIAAVNGNARIHSEQALLADVVLCAEDALWADHAHFSSGIVPGDGVQVIFPLLMGYNRARYFLLTGQELTSREALTMGLVNEVLPREELLSRAYHLAEQFLSKPNLALRSTRTVLVNMMKRMFADNLGYGLSLEGIAAIDMLKDIRGEFHVGD